MPSFTLRSPKRPLLPVQGWLSVLEVADRLGRTEIEVLELIRTGPLNASVIGKRLMVHSASLKDIAPAGIVSAVLAHAEGA